jgi:hypothetical protein
MMTWPAASQKLQIRLRSTVNYLRRDSEIGVRAYNSGSGVRRWRGSFPHPLHGLTLTDMSGNLVAPRPVRIFTSLQLPFFLSNALYTSNAPNPVLHAHSVTVPLPEPEVDVPPEPSAPTAPAPSAPSASGNQSGFEASNIKSTLSPTESGENEKSLEELAASICLDDEPQAQYAQYPPQNIQNQYYRPPSTSFLFGSRSSATSPPASARSILEDGPPATPR